MATIVNTSLNTEPRLGNLRYNLSTMERSVNPVMSVDVEKFGKGEDLSDTKPTQKIHESFEWLSAIFNGAASNRVMNTMRIVEDENCAPRIFVGRQANLVPTRDPGTLCCVKMPTMEGRAFYTNVKQFCVEDALNDDDIFYLINTGMPELNLQANPLGLKGTNAYQRRLEMLRRTFIFQMARQFLFGETDVAGDNLLPFTGIQELLSHASVVNLDGTNLVGVIHTISCFTDMLKGDWIVLGNQFALKQFNKQRAQIKAVMGEDLLSGIRQFDVSLMDVNDDLESDLIFLNLDHVGAIVGQKTLNPMARELETEQDIKDEPITTQGACKVIVNRIRERGGMFTDDFNSVIRVTNVGVPTECLPVIGRLLNNVGVETILPR